MKEEVILVFKRYWDCFFSLFILDYMILFRSKPTKKIYQLKSVTDNYKSIDYRNLDVYSLLDNTKDITKLNGTRLNWWEERGGQFISDCPFIIGSLPVFDYIKLGSSLSGFNSSFRKAIFDVDNKKYTAIQANIISGLLDEEKSSIRWFTSGKIMEVYDYIFNSSSDFPSLFKLKEYPIYTFCTEEVADKLRDCNFRQLELVECKNN